MLAMTHALRHLTTIASAIVLLTAAAPALAQNAMAPAPDANTMAPAADANTMAPAADNSMMAADAMAADDMMMAAGAKQEGDAMMSTGGKLVQITIEDLTTGQPFSPSFFESRTADSAPLFNLGDKASDALVAVAEGGQIGPFSVGAAMNKDSTLGDAALAIHTLPGQTRTLWVHVDEKHPLIDGVWMLGNTNDGFSGISGVNGFTLTAPQTIEVRGYDAGSEKNSEKKGYLGALGGGNERDPENGVITYHTGIRGDADAPIAWNWDVSKPVARVTITPVAGM
jgi:hypothetical protein